MYVPKRNMYTVSSYQYQLHNAKFSGFTEPSVMENKASSCSSNRKLKFKLRTILNQVLIGLQETLSHLMADCFIYVRKIKLLGMSWAFSIHHWNLLGEFFLRAAAKAQSTNCQVEQGAARIFPVSSFK